MKSPMKYSTFSTADFFFMRIQIFLGNLKIFIHLDILKQPYVISMIVSCFISPKSPQTVWCCLLLMEAFVMLASISSIRIILLFLFFQYLLPNLLANKTKDFIQLQVSFFICKIDVVSLVKLNICQFLAFIFSF